MYPAGFSLMKRVVAYIEREDELDINTNADINANTITHRPCAAPVVSRSDEGDASLVAATYNKAEELPLDIGTMTSKLTSYRLSQPLRFTLFGDELAQYLAKKKSSSSRRSKEELQRDMDKDIGKDDGINEDDAAAVALLKRARKGDDWCSFAAENNMISRVVDNRPEKEAKPTTAEGSVDNESFGDNENVDLNDAMKACDSFEDSATSKEPGAPSITDMFPPPRRVLTGDFSLRLEKELSVSLI
jgi:hypothetical protein